MMKELGYALDTYISNIRLILVFSIAFVIASLIPLFASLPTYNSVGAIFLRTASVYVNLNPFNTAVILISTFFSLLFLSFAMVAINIVVKHRRTRTRISKEVMEGLEKYTGKVFAVLFIATLILALVNIVSYNTVYSGVLTAIAALIITPFIFYAPASIVIDDNRISRSVKMSLDFFTKNLSYFLFWMVLAFAVLTILDLILINIANPAMAKYLMLGISSLFVLPFLVVLQGEFYMNRFKLLKR